MGRCYATSGRQQPTRRLHAPSIFPQLKEADAAHAPRACRAARELAAGPDTFVLWVDRCRPVGAGGEEVGAGRKNVPAEQPQQELRTRRGVAANKRVAPTKLAAREPRRENWGGEESRKGDEMSLGFKLFAFITGTPPTLPPC